MIINNQIDNTAWPEGKCSAGDYICNIFQSGECLDMTRGKVIYSPESRSSNVYFLEEGAIRVYNFNAGKVFIKYFIFSDEIFGMDGLIGLQEYQNFAEVISPVCKIRILKSTDFSIKMNNNIQLGNAAILALQNREYAIYRRIRHKTFLSTEEVIIDLIREIAQRTGIKKDHEIIVPYMPVQSDVATYLGVSRQNVSTAFARLKKNGVIDYTRKNFKVLNMELLNL